MIYLFDKDENIKNILSIDEIENEVHERRLGQEWSFIFETRLEYLPYLIKNSKVGFYDSERQFRLFYVDEEPEIDYLDKTIKVHTSHDSYRLTNIIVESVYLQDATPNKAMTSALVKTDYEVGVVEVTGSEMLKLVDLTVYEVLYSLSELYDGELDFRIEFDEKGQKISRKLVDFKNRLGSMTNLRFTFGLNVDNVVRTEISNNHFNVLYGRGKTSTDEEGNETTLTFEDVVDDDKPLGQGYVEDLESIAKYGRLEGIYKNGHFELADALLKRTREILQQVKDPVYNYVVTVNDLSDDEGFEHFKVAIGDDIIILDEERGLQLKQRVVGISETLKDKAKTLYVSHLPVTYTGDIDKVLSNSESRLSEIVTEINDVEKGLSSKIEQTAEKIETKVSKGEIVSSINQSAETIKIKASKIDLNGYVTISSLSGDGTTNINGANITTGVIKSTDSSIWLDLNQGKMMFYEDATFLGSTNRLYDRWTGKYGLGMLSNTNSFVAFSTGEQDYATIYNPELVIAGKDTVNKDTGEIRYRKGINMRADVHGGHYKNAGFSWTDFPRSKSDGINLYKGIGGDGSQSELILELGDDYSTNFKIISKMYNKDYADMVAMFRGTGGSENNPSNNAGIHFYQNLDMHGYRIWGAQALNAMSLEIESDDAYIKSQSHISFATAEGFKVTKTQYISTSTQKSVNHVGSVIVENKAEYVELPNDFLMCVNVNVVATPNKLCKFAVTHVDEYGFIIECDETEVKFDYSVTAHKI